jgi:rubrerythrin
MRMPRVGDILLTMPTTFWIITGTLAAAVVAYGAVRLRRAGDQNDQDKLRMLQGRCLKCGYDLQGNHAKCPRCGTMPSPERL